MGKRSKMDLSFLVRTNKALLFFFLRFSGRFLIPPAFVMYCFTPRVIIVCKGRGKLTGGPAQSVKFERISWGRLMLGVWRKGWLLCYPVQFIARPAVGRSRVGIFLIVLPVFEARGKDIWFGK